MEGVARGVERRVPRRLHNGRKYYGLDKHLAGRIVAEQDEPRGEEAAAMIRAHLDWLQSNRPASTGRRGDVAGAGAAGNSSGARASDHPDDLREQHAAAWARLAGRSFMPRSW